MPTSDIIQRVTEWLASLVDNPAAAGEFAESPATSLANHDLSQSDLDGVDLRSVAGGLGGSAGVSPEGRTVLTQFAQSPQPSHHVSPVHEVAHVTRVAHQDNPHVTKIFQDNSVNIDNSQTFVNNGFVGGDITFDNDVNVAKDGGVIATDNHGPVVVGTNGSVAAGDDVTQAKNSTVAQDSQIGNNGGNGGNGNGVPANDARGGQDDQGRQQDQGHEGQPGHDGQSGHDLPFGQGDSDQHEQDDQHQGDQDDQHEGDQGGHDTNAEDGGHPDAGTHDPTAGELDHQPELDPTHGDSQPEHAHSQHFAHQAVPEIDHHGAEHPPLDDHLLDA